MKLALAISGGFAPTVTSGRFILDTASLTAGVQQQVEELVRALMAAPRPQLSPKLRDAQSYELTITSDNSHETIFAGDGSVPPPMRTLITLIKAQGSRK